MDGIHDAKGEMMFLRVKCEGGNDYQLISWVGLMGPITKQSLVEIKNLGTGEMYVVGNK